MEDGIYIATNEERAEWAEEMELLEDCGQVDIYPEDEA